MSADVPQIGADGFEVPKVIPPSLLYPRSNLTRKIIGCAFEVHKELGHGFLEKVYVTCLLYELKAAGLAAVPEAPIPVLYKKQPAGIYYADILVEGSVICEIKAIEGLLPVHEAQLLHYLKATRLNVGLLINFGTPRVQLKRMVRSK